MVFPTNKYKEKGCGKLRRLIGHCPIEKRDFECKSRNNGNNNNNNDNDKCKKKKRLLST
ncbi:hypothetical protein PP707_05715 [Acetobacter pasteurianus]|nr:hypothetical protein [Acetobacter pasteurianus]